jgi:hypothetical protein
MLKRADLFESIPLPLIIQCAWSGTGHASVGGARSQSISDRMSANVCPDTATSANWNVP